MTIAIDTLNTVTKNAYLPQVFDNIWKTNPTLMYLRDRSKPQNGGLTVRFPLAYDDTIIGGAYSGYDKLKTENPDHLTTAVYNWVQTYEPVSISKLDELKNSGKERVVSLLNEKMSRAENAVNKFFTDKLFAAAGANESDEILSLNDLVAINRLVGGINSTGEPWWDARVAANAATDIAELVTATDPDYLLDSLSAMWNLCSDGRETPDIVITTDAVIEAYEHIVGAAQRWDGDSKMADAGFTVFKYKGAQMVADKSCTPGQVFFLNTKYLGFRHHPEDNMIFEPFRKPADQNVKVGYFNWTGQLGMGQPRRQGKITGIPTA